MSGQTGCRICGSVRVAGRHDVREMMFGTRETFGYTQCADCLCLQIDEVPPDLARQNCQANHRDVAAIDGALMLYIGLCKMEKPQYDFLEKMQQL